MKKLLVVLLSLGLIVAFSAAASAATTMSVGGAYYVGGIYEDNASLVDNQENSTARFHQRLRMGVNFQIQEGLSFSTRFDALEKNWGSNNWSAFDPKTGNGDTNSSRKGNSVVKVQENFELEYSFITFKTAIGQFQVGYQDCDSWGTPFSNASNSRPKILYTTVLGPVTAGLAYEKWYEANSSQTPANFTSDSDFDIYGVFGIYKWKAGEAGLLYRYLYNASGSDLAAPNSFKGKVHQVAPYFKSTFGPVFLEGEVNYFFGKAIEYDIVPVGKTDVDAKTLTAHLHAKMNMGPAYVGAKVGYASGDDPAKTDEAKQLLGGNTSYFTGLIIGAGERILWQEGTKLGGLNGATGAAAAIDDKKLNLVSYNLYGGYNVTPKLNIEANLLYAMVAEKPTAAYVSKKLGFEADLMATYKIFDNLSYYVGAGYLWAGDYWKGTNAANSVGDDFVLLNRLQLAF